MGNAVASALKMVSISETLNGTEHNSPLALLAFASFETSECIRGLSVPGSGLSFMQTGSSLMITSQKVFHIVIAGPLSDMPAVPKTSKTSSYCDNPDAPPILTQPLPHSCPFQCQLVCPHIAGQSQRPHYILEFRGSDGRFVSMHPSARSPVSECREVSWPF